MLRILACYVTASVAALSGVAHSTDATQSDPTPAVGIFSRLDKSLFLPESLQFKRFPIKKHIFKNANKRMWLLRNVAAFWLYSHQDLTKVNKSSCGGQESTFNVFNFCLTSNKLMDFHQQRYDGESIFTVPPRRRGGTRENRGFLCELSERRSLWMNEAWMGVTPPPVLKITITSQEVRVFFYSGQQCKRRSAHFTNATDGIPNGGICDSHYATLCTRCR